MLGSRVEQPLPPPLAGRLVPPTCLVVGLGHLEAPTRADVGAAAVHAAPGGVPLSRAGSWLYRRVPLEGTTVLAGIFDVPPDRSGPLVKQLLESYRLSSLIVLHEDPQHLELGLVRIRTRGADGGHAGMRSIMQALGRTDVTRVRIGVGRPGQEPGSIPPATFSAVERALLPAVFEGVWRAVALLALHQVERAMSNFNRRDLTVDGRAAAPHILPGGRIRGEVPRPRRPRRNAESSSRREY